MNALRCQRIVGSVAALHVCGRVASWLQFFRAWSRPLCEDCVRELVPSVSHAGHFVPMSEEAPA